MPNGKRASMREGPLAALFRKTSEELSEEEEKGGRPPRAAPGDFAALQFEQSVLLIDANGGDLNNSDAAKRTRYACGT